MKSKFAMLAAGLVGALAPAAMSACVYTITADAPTYNVGAGTATVKVYLNETLTDGSTSFVDSATQNGVLAVSFSLDRTSGDSAKITTVASGGAFPDVWWQAADSSVWQASTSPTFTTGNFLANIMGANGSKFNGAPLHLATITIAADAGTTTSQFAITIPNYGTGSVATWEGYALDMDAASQGLAADAFVPVTGSTFQVAVPEPSMIGLALVSGMMLLRRR